MNTFNLQNLKKIESSQMKAYLIFFLLLFTTQVYSQQAPILPILKSTIKGINIYGKTVDNQTRCQHWHSELDVIAIKFKCCEKYYPCFSCHEEEADHEPKFGRKIPDAASIIIFTLKLTQLKSDWLNLSKYNS